ncbi:MAG: hotdog fold thioesterase [Cyclobacteriaceae bacterium]
MSDQSKSIFDQMYASDWFSIWLGIEMLEVRLGYCKLKMVVTKEMLNGFGVAHGGITFSFADSAFAFASNSRNNKSVSIETSINHVKAVHEGDELIAEATEEEVTNKTGVYRVIVTRQGEKVAIFKGLVYRTGKKWLDA